MASWATLAEVVDITGQEASAENLALAQTMISIFSGTTTVASDDELISSTNLRLLSQAVAFQAVWLASHPDVLDAMDVAGVSQDGLSAQYASAHAHLLAPMARICLARLSWRKAALRARRSRTSASMRGSRDSAVRDDQYVWTPL